MNIELIFSPSKPVKIDKNNYGIWRRIMGKRLTYDDVLKIIGNGQIMYVGGRLVGKTTFAQIMAEIKAYKELEEGLGIDLITLFRALKNGIYFRNPINNEINNSSLMCGELEISGKGLTMLSTEMDILFYFKDYGKTWSLDEKDLMKEELL